jgi:hypothetical protein
VLRLSLGVSRGLSIAAAFAVGLAVMCGSAWAASPIPDGTQAPTASEIGTWSATLNGVINTHGASARAISIYYFEYGTDTTYGQSTPETVAVAGDGDQIVTARVTGLVGGTRLLGGGSRWHFRLVITIDGVTTASDDASFATLPLPRIDVLPATDVTTTQATLHGRIDADGQTGTFGFVVDNVYGGYPIATDGHPLSGAGTHEVSAVVTGLHPRLSTSVRLLVTIDGVIMDGETFYHGGSTGSLVTSALPVAPKDPCRGPMPVEAYCWSMGPSPATPDANAVPVAEQPSSAFTVTQRSVSGTSAVLAVRVPGAGKIHTTASRTRVTTTTAAKAGTKIIKIKLTTAGIRALGKAKSRTLKRSLRVTYTPAGGQPTSKNVVVTFKRKGGR